jgi:hypothetical protein
LKEHAELSPDLIELSLRQGGDVLAVDPDLAPVGLQEADEVLRNTDLPVPEGPSKTVTLPFGTSKVMSSRTF